MTTNRMALAAAGLALGAQLASGGTVLRVLRAGEAGVPLLRNGGFEAVENGRPAAWSAAPQGFGLRPGEGRQGTQALACENPSGKGWFGGSQALQLNRNEAAPLVVRGWSRAEGVSGGADSDYSLYVDLLYEDGTPLWGQTASFRCGTHDWEKREVIILPEKPVKSLTFYCLFRNHGGKVWFDDLEVREMRAEDGSALFQGVPVQRVSERKDGPPEWTAFFGGAADRADALRLAGDGGGGWPSLFLARDVAADSDFFGFENGVCRELGLKLEAQSARPAGAFGFSGRITDLTGRDRAVTLVFAWPQRLEGWQWGDDLRRSRRISDRGDYTSQVSVPCGATGTMSLYPVGAVWQGSNGLALGLDMARPARSRIGCQAGLGLLYLACDFGLVKETERFPGGADFGFVLFPFDGGLGFRGAWQKFMELYPAYFVVRSKEQGLWMPFTEVGRVKGWQDFGFRYHEGNNNVPWDDENGILSFRYTEPMTWWMTMKKDLPHTTAGALRVRDDIARGKEQGERRMAEVSHTAAMFDEMGEPCLRFLDTPWCNGAVWSLNPNPFLGPESGLASGTNLREGKPQLLNAATVHWDDATKERLYGPQAKGRLDGEYLDSLEGYVTADLNFRRAHFRQTTVPLTFSSADHQPALFKGLAVFEFTKWISDDVHRLGKLMFANGVPYRFTFLCPWLDVMGTETDWLRDGRYRPAAISQMDLWRAMSGAKPYLLLMNTDYDRFTADLVEKYFQRCLFYGMWPGFFSHNAADNPYWDNPKWYERDRALFVKYIPIVRRVAEAGWQPVPHATAGNPEILVERFGPGSGGAVYVTLFNDSSKPQEGRLRIEAGLLGLGATPAATRELISGQEPEKSPTGWEVRLRPQEARVFELNQQAAARPGS